MTITKLISKRIADLTQDPANARTHNERNMKAIKASLSRFGQQKPVVILDGGQIVAGNGTVKAARDLGWKNVDVVVFTGTVQEARAYAIADNRTAELAAWDMDELLGTLGEFDSALIEASGWSLQEIQSVIDPSGEWLAMPEFESKDVQSAWHCTVHFLNMADVEAFFALIEKEQSKVVWYPEDDDHRSSRADVAYVSKGQ